MGTFWKLIRGRHWVKNTFVFTPAFFAAQWSAWTDPGLWLLFLAFCTAASSVYIFNDWMDREADRLHPLKKHRPLASGAVTLPQAQLTLGLLLGATLILSFFLPHSWYYLVAYLLLNLGYSTFLKKWPIIDVSCIALGFLLRIIAGGAEVDVPISTWMVIVVFLLTVSIAWAKRRNDTLLLGPNVAQELLPFYTIATSIGLGLTLMAYLLYCIDPTTVARLQSDRIYYTAFFVFLGLLRYLQLIFTQQQSGDPTTLLWEDRFLQITLLAWMLSFAILIYGVV